KVVALLGLTIPGQYYLVTLGYSLVFSLAALGLFARNVAKSTLAGIVGITALLFSRAYIDFSVSGLENPLSHLLLLGFFALYFRRAKTTNRRIFWLTLIASLGVLNRQDTLLLYLPSLIYVLIKVGLSKKSVFNLFLGGLPIILWELYSIIYYGFPFPNTYYAKLHTGINPTDLVQQGVYYFIESLRNDPGTLSVIGFVALLAMIQGIWRKHWPLLVGISLYLLYILRIGGDFMSGRFFAAPLLLSVILLSRLESKSNSSWGQYALLFVILGSITPNPTILSGLSYGEDQEINSWIDDHGIANERAIYYRETGWLAGNREKIEFEIDWIINEGKFTNGILLLEPREISTAGWNGYLFGPQSYYLIDKSGLLNPFISRLPIENLNQWRIGHFHHIVPDGYEETIANGVNKIADPNLAAYYAVIQEITRGEIWTTSRFVEIWKINTGQYNYLIAAYNMNHAE
ncbi:MAG: hypothetical protein N2D54_03525, partial [Chloroflexota bacterium]